MTSCCDSKNESLEKLHARQGWVLKTVLFINLVMFVVEFTSGVIANSTALMADSLDMLGDSLVYSFSLYVLHRSDHWKARSAMLKGGIMALFGMGVLGESIYKLITMPVPDPVTMGLIGLLALTANSICFALLWSHRSDDINMQSTWICSRNDLIANTGVLIAGIGVYLSQSFWPDVIIGLIIAGLFLKDSTKVISNAFKKMSVS